MSAISILLVEDDYDLAATVLDFLSLEGITADHAASGEAGLTLAQTHPYDVLILDLNLPKMDGLTLCKRLREAGHDTPVLMLTARDTIDDKLAGFRVGTDDYLVKPFEISELVARLQVLARRRSGEAKKLTVGELTMWIEKREVYRGEKRLKLTPTCWKMLEVLMRKSPEVVSRQRLEEAVWRDDPPESNSLKVHLYKLRQQVDGGFSNPMIHTIAGHGFKVGDHDTP